MESSNATHLRGRCISITGTRNTGHTVTLRNESGMHEAKVRGGDPFQTGDLIEIHEGAVRLLTRNRNTVRSMSWMERTLDPRRRRAIEMRGRVEAGIREFFTWRGFLEVRTPLMVPSPGMEPHIRPYRLESGAYLPTSPEFAMKRLLVGGLERIFQLSPAFRREPRSKTHHPEFLMLEWYRAYAGYEEILRDTEELFEFLANKIFGKSSVLFQGREISVATPWPRFRVRDLFLEKAEIDLVKASSVEAMRRGCDRLKLSWAETDTWDDLYFRIWLNVIEPSLPADRAVFVTRYPASQAALAVVDTDPDGSRWAKRFELYAGGLELGNAFEELTHPDEQRSRFVKDMDLRERIYGSEFPKTALDEEFLGALQEGMPPSGGIAVGVDRMVMLFADETDIEKTVWLPSHDPAGQNLPR